MQTIIQIEPNEWVSEDLLMAVTGMKRGTITRARNHLGCLAGSISTFPLKESLSQPANACTTAKR